MHTVRVFVVITTNIALNAYFPNVYLRLMGHSMNTDLT